MDMLTEEKLQFCLKEFSVHLYTMDEAANTWRRRKYPGVSLPSLMIMSACVV